MAEPAVSLVPARRAAEPDLEALISLVVDTVRSPESKRAYRRGIGDFLRWCREARGVRPFVKRTVEAYRDHLRTRGLAPTSINVRMSAIRRLAAEAADNGIMEADLAAGIGRTKGEKALGRRTGNWLTRQQAQQLLNTPNANTVVGRRDQALLSVMVGCGLRRSELASLEFRHIQQREGRWVIVDLIGKGQRVRSVPMPSWAKAAIDDWAAAADIHEGRIFRSVNRGGHVHGAGMTPEAVFKIVRAAALRIGIPIAPHDLRRTFAKLAHRGGAPVEQIQLSLGHSSIQTTERYLGVQQDLADAPCDHLGIKRLGPLVPPASPIESGGSDGVVGVPR
jgi:site-specific recombinase XerD